MKHVLHPRESSSFPLRYVFLLGTDALFVGDMG